MENRLLVIFVPDDFPDDVEAMLVPYSALTLTNDGKALEFDIPAEIQAKLGLSWPL